jgi:hypothetical protein
MPLTADVLDAYEPVPEEWDRFAREQRLIRAWDAAAFAAMADRPRRVWLALVRDRERPVAAFAGRLLGPGTGGRVLAGPLECKLPLVGAPGFAFAAELDQADRRAAVAAFERALFRRLGWRCLGVAYRQVATAELAVLRRHRGRVHLATSPDAVLKNRWATMEQYFAWLPSKHRRKKLRYLQRQVARDPELLVGLARDGVDGAEASRLAHLTNLRHRRLQAPVPPPAAYFEAMAGRHGALYLTYRDRAAGRLLAYDLAFDDGTWLVASVWGSLDPHGEGRPHLYFDRCLRLVAYVVEHRRAGVRFGKGLLEVKQRFGAVPVPQHLVAVVR